MVPVLFVLMRTQEDVMQYTFLPIVSTDLQVALTRQEMQQWSAKAVKMKTAS